jgi:hypothetical protein
MISPSGQPQVTQVAETDDRRGPRIALAIFLVILVLLYSLGVVGGWIKASSRIDAVHLALIVLTGVLAVALVRPQALERLKRVKLSGFELEMLARVQERQAEHESQLDDIRLILPLLLPGGERNHLLNLESGNTRRYTGSHSLRSELRRMRSMHLLRMKQGRHVGELKDGGTYDLADFVELTRNGQRWIARVREIESESGE